MSDEQSIRDELTLIARDVHLYDGGTNQALAGFAAQRIADAILASPVIRRIQAEAWDEADDAILAAVVGGAEITASLANRWPRNPYREEATDE